MEWQDFPYPADYVALCAMMEARVAAIRAGEASEAVWTAEFPPLYTAGTSASDADVIEARFPVHRVGRGGKLTYHGPGQRVCYVMLDLDARKKRDVRAYVRHLEEWLIRALWDMGVKGERREDRVGIWTVDDNGVEAKIAAIGVRMRKWVTYHGVALNVAPDLSHYGGIVPCGIRDYGVTSLRALGVRADMPSVDAALRRRFDEVFLCF
ncbi:MAG: lipoyl(octanoyl) transferase LipB [Rickettsiales bacterium]